MLSQDSFNKFIIASARQIARRQKEALRKSQQNHLQQRAGECQARLQFASTARDRNAILQQFGSAQLETLNAIVNEEIEAVHSILEISLKQDPVFHFDWLKDKSTFLPSPST